MSSLYLCRDCSGAFASFDDLQRHERSEHPAVTSTSIENPVSGEFENLEHLSVSLKMEEDTMSDTDSSNHSTNRTSPSSESKGRYECDDCHEQFSVKRELATHMRIHSGEQPHQCTQCGKEFGTRQLLKKHWMWHTGQRSHVCPHCNKAFFQKGHLTQHLMIHSGGRPHECPQCHKTFIFKFDLNRHMKIHQERGFSCQQCGRSFLKQAMLDEHFHKCKGKPSSPHHHRPPPLTPTMKLTNPAFVEPPKVMLTSEQIAQMAHKIFANHEQRSSAFTSLLIKQDQLDKNANNNNFDVPVGLAANISIPTVPLMCMICKMGFGNQAAFTLHMYMHHIAHQPALSVDSASSVQNAMLVSGDAEPGTDTSCASSPQKVSPSSLESCLEQSSVSPSSSTSAGHCSSPRLTLSESSANCKECAACWHRIHELEQQVVKKGEEFETYRNMMKMIVNTVSNMLNQCGPENVFATHANNIFKQLQNSL